MREIVLHQAGRFRTGERFLTARRWGESGLTLRFGKLYFITETCLERKAMENVSC